MFKYLYKLTGHFVGPKCSRGELCLNRGTSGVLRVFFVYFCIHVVVSMSDVFFVFAPWSGERTLVLEFGQWR